MKIQYKEIPKKTNNKIKGNNKMNRNSKNKSISLKKFTNEDKNKNKA